MTIDRILINKAPNHRLIWGLVFCVKTDLGLFVLKLVFKRLYSSVYISG